MSGGLILCYHRVLPGPLRDPFGIIDRLKIHVPRTRFRQHMDILLRRFTVVPLSEFVDRLVRAAPVDGLAAITLDDGYADTYEHAFPILKRLGVPATVFVATDFIDQASFWWDQLAWTLTRTAGGSLPLPSDWGGPVVLDSGEAVREVFSRLSLRLRAIGKEARREFLHALEAADLPDARPLTWTEIRSMQAAGISFGAHSCSHPSLPHLPDPDLFDEVAASRDCIAVRLGPAASPIFAYPYGDVDARVSDATRTAGFLGAVSLGDRLCGGGLSLFDLPRLMVRNWSPYFFAKALDALNRGDAVIRDPGVPIRQTVKGWLPLSVREGIRRVRGRARRWGEAARRLTGS
jgi:peptidoglycan/xylan/chitin deacetylase (PgdA/CDA1 family)